MVIQNLWKNGSFKTNLSELYLRTSLYRTPNKYGRSYKKWLFIKKYASTRFRKTEIAKVQIIELSNIILNPLTARTPNQNNINAVIKVVILESKIVANDFHDEDR